MDEWSHVILSTMEIDLVGFRSGQEQVVGRTIVPLKKLFEDNGVSSGWYDVVAPEGEEEEGENCDEIGVTSNVIGEIKIDMMLASAPEVEMEMEEVEYPSFTRGGATAEDI